MKTHKTPTARELLKKEFGDDKKVPINLQYCSTERMMVKYAKLHVKAALEAAAERLCCDEDPYDSIMNAYPDELIK